MPHRHPRVRVERGLYKTGDTYYAAATPPGARQRRWKSLGNVNLSRARDLRDAFAVEVRSGRARPRHPGRAASFAFVADEWLEVQKGLVAIDELRPRTYALYEGAVRLHQKPFFQGRTARSVSGDDLVRWQTQQRELGASVWSIKARWTPLRLILAYSARHGHADSNPADHLDRRERPRAGRPRQRFLTDEEIATILVAAPKRWRLLVAVCLFGGLRISEALGLVWADVDRDAAVIRVRYQLSRDGERTRLKSGKGKRDVVLMDALSRELRAAKLAARFSDARHPVFATANGTAISARNASRQLAKTIRIAELDGVTFHTLRHTFASILIAQGRDAAFVADQLGHEDPAFTWRTYVHLFRAAQQASAARAQLEADFGHVIRGTS
jgi:integrase